MKVRVIVTPRKGILDPQGKAIEGSLGRMGYAGVNQVRVGKVIDFVIQEKDDAKAKVEVEEMCKKLLANPVIEDARYEFVK